MNGYSIDWVWLIKAAFWGYLIWTALLQLPEGDAKKEQEKQ